MILNFYLERVKIKMAFSNKKYLIGLLVIFSLHWIICAVNPLDRKDWFLENTLVFAFILFFIFTYKKFPLSKISLTLIFIFLFLHEIGARYTYSEVPYNEWSKAVLGKSLNEIVGWQRNNFDRLVHFSYGLLFAYPIREVYLRIANAKGFWGYFLPLDFTMSTSMIYELIEWAAAEIFGGELGAAYLGTQGDVWDAHKDMLLATTGAVVAMTITALINIYLKREEFGKEWSESLRVKKRMPLGENKILKIIKRKKEK